MLGEKEVMPMPKLTHESRDETNQSSSERANDGKRGTFTLHVTPVNLSAQFFVAPGMPSMCQTVLSMRISPAPLIPFSCPQLPQILACVLYQKLLHVVGEGKNSDIFHLHQVAPNC